MYKKFVQVVLIFLSATLCSALIVQGATSPRETEKLPLWEIGAIALAARLPHYRGSDEYQNYAFPLPYFVYRGEVVKASRDGIRGIFWRNKKFQTDISLSGNPPVSSDNDTREGMPDLDPLVEIGPALRYYFDEFGERDSFYLQANLRTAFSVGFDDGFDMAHEGYISDLSLVYKDSRLFKSQNVRFQLSSTIQFSDGNLHSYFYEVAPNHATPVRQQYKAKGGYGGLKVSGSILKELTAKFWVGLYAQWMNIDGAVFQDSPLVRTSNNYVLGTMLVWKIGESKKFEQ